MRDRDHLNGLDGVQPPDQWDEVTRRVRAGDGALARDEGARTRRPVLLAAAALVVALAIVSAVLAWPDDERADVDTGLAGTSSTATTAKPQPDPAPAVFDGECPFAVSGEARPFRHQPLGEDEIARAPELALGYGGYQDGANIASAVFYSGAGGPDDASAQPVEVSVPGTLVTDLLGEDVAEIDFGRGPSTLWLIAETTVQVRYFDGTQDPCGSFTVTVGGPERDANRHVAIDLAQRILLPRDSNDLADALVGTWAATEIVVGGDQADERTIGLGTFGPLVLRADGTFTFPQPAPCQPLEGDYSVLASQIWLMYGDVLALGCGSDAYLQAAHVIGPGSTVLLEGDTLTLKDRGDAITFVRS